MHPWFWIWAPQWQLPLSGNVTQDIAPVAQLFGGRGGQGRGDPLLEQRAFEIASYGQQLGLITEVLLALAEEQAPADPAARQSLTRLQGIREQIEALKPGARTPEVPALVAAVDAVLAGGGAEAAALRRQLGARLKR